MHRGESLAGDTLPFREIRPQPQLGQVSKPPLRTFINGHTKQVHGKETLKFSYGHSDCGR